MRQDRLFVDQYEGNNGCNFPEYVKGGRLLYAHKATEGIYHTDTKHKERVLLAHEHGLAVLHYHYCRPDQSDVSMEMHNFWSQVMESWQRYDFLGLDFETKAKWETIPQAQNYIEQAWAMLHKVSGHTARPYGSTSFLKENTRRNWLRFKPRWQAQYGYDPGRSIWGTNWWAWQFTDGKYGPTPHYVKGVGVGDVSLLNALTTVKLRVLLARRQRAVHK